MDDTKTGTRQELYGEHMDLATIPVAKIMSPSPTTVRSDASVRTAIQTLVDKKIAGVPIVNEANQLLGVVSENDLLLLAASGHMSHRLHYKENPDFIRADSTLKEALVKMIKLKRKWFPVLDDSNKIIGIIARRDLLKVLLGENA